MICYNVEIWKFFCLSVWISKTAHFGTMYTAKDSEFWFWNISSTATIIKINKVIIQISRKLWRAEKFFNIRTVFDLDTYLSRISCSDSSEEWALLKVREGQVSGSFWGSMKADKVGVDPGQDWYLWLQKWGVEAPLPAQIQTWRIADLMGVGPEFLGQPSLWFSKNLPFARSFVNVEAEHRLLHDKRISRGLRRPCKTHHGEWLPDADTDYPIGTK